MLSLSLLGPFAAALDDSPITSFRTKSVQALLIYLACEADRPIQRDSLLGLLWPGLPQASAQKNLRQTLYFLRQIIPDVAAQDSDGRVPLLLSDRQTVQFNPEAAVDLDAASFTTLLQGDLSGWPEAVALYRGDFLSDFYLPDSSTFEEWTLARRESYRRQALDALDHLTEQFTETADYAQAESYARRQLEIDELRESAYRQLMTILAAQGDRAGALRIYHTCAEIMQRELGAEPSPATQQLYESLLDVEAVVTEAVMDRSEPVQTAQIVPSHRSPLVPPQPRHNLPTQTTPFVGRETELAELSRLFNDPAVRLVTILGPGGMGKTRLALEAAAKQLDHFEHGVFLVRLAPLNEPENIVPTVAEAINFSFYEGSAPEQQLQDYLREKRLLLVMDSYEHLLDGVGVVINLLKIAPRLKIVATARARLNVQEERLFPISGIDFPDVNSPDESSQSSAVQLFLEGAQRVQPSFTLTEGNSSPVVQICRLVQGMPLGIILAAAWLELLTPAEIADELSRSLDFLESEMRDLPERQRSIRAVFDHSWRLLSESEREVFQQLSVFRGGFTREAAEAVASASLRPLMSLVNKSLLQRDTDGRFEVHELLRQYGGEKLAADPVQEIAVRDRHCAFYCGVLGRREVDLKGAQQLAAVNEIEADIENVRMAWSWAINHDRIEAIEQALDSLYEFYRILSRFQEGFDAFGRAVTRIQADAQTAKAEGNGITDILLTKLLARQGTFGSELGLYESINDLLRTSLEMAQRFKMLREHALCLKILGDIQHIQGVYLEAEKLYRESLDISQASGDLLAEAALLNKWGWMKGQQGDYGQAYRLLQQSLNLHREVEHQFGTAESLNNLASTAWNSGKIAEAEQFWTESLALSRELGNSLGIALQLGGLGAVAWGLGGDKLPQAKHLMEERLVIIRELGHRAELLSSYCLLADVLNDLGDYLEAEKQGIEALTIAKQIHRTFGLAWSLCILSEAATGLKDYPVARKHCYEALEIAESIPHQPAISLALVSLAKLLAKDTDRSKQQTAPNIESTPMKTSNEQVIEILTLAINHPATWPVHKARAARLRDEIENRLPLEVVEAARERGEARDLMDTARELLAELEQAGTTE